MAFISVKAIGYWSRVSAKYHIATLYVYIQNRTTRTAKPKGKLHVWIAI